MAITFTTTMKAEDVESLKFCLALEGCEWKDTSHVPGEPLESWIRFHHPQHGNTYFGNWDTVEKHYRDDWKDTYWPHP